MFAIFFDKFDRGSLVAAGLLLAIVAGVFAGSVRAQTAPARILLLATGGTIAGQASARAGNAYDSGKVSGANLVAAVPGLDKVAQISAEQISSIGSQDMNDKGWFDLPPPINTPIHRKT